MVSGGAVQAGTLDAILVPYGQRKSLKCKAVYDVEKFPADGLVKFRSPPNHHCERCRTDGYPVGSPALATPAAAKAQKTTPAQQRQEPERMKTRRTHTASAAAAPAIEGGRDRHSPAAVQSMADALGGSHREHGVLVGSAESLHKSDSA